MIDYILDFIYPPRCTFCHKLTQNGERVCGKCLKGLPYTENTELNRAIPDVSRCFSPLYYENFVRDSLLRYKFGGLKGYAKVYGKILSKSIDEMGISCDIISWVPLSGKRLRKRGYDQAGLLAAELADNLGIDCVKLLKKVKNNPAQSGTGSPSKRKANVKGVYRAIDPAFIEGKTILLIDDIVTTGATLSECAGVLKKNGALLVYAAALACSKN